MNYAFCMYAGCAPYFMYNHQKLQLSSSQTQWLYGWFRKEVLIKSTLLEESYKKILLLFWESAKRIFFLAQKHAWGWEIGPEIYSD